MSKIKDLTGQRFGRLIVTKKIGISKWNKVIWECKCDCGNIITSNASYLARDTQSCGCLKKEKIHNRCWKGYGEISQDFWSTIKRNAFSRGIEFNISIEEAWKIYTKQNHRCALTGLYIYFSKNTKKKKPTASLDRINSMYGYIKENIQWVHKKVNIMKNIFCNDEFNHFCKLVIQNKEKGVKVVAASGGFDCLHAGHVEYLQMAKTLGDQLIVIVNTDEFLIKKKGYVFMPLKERLAIISALRCVDDVVASVDKDQTVCETLRLIKPDIFAKGGDRSATEIPEAAVCAELNIKIIDGLGDKIQSSSDLVKKSKALKEALEEYRCL